MGSQREGKDKEPGDSFCVTVLYKEARPSSITSATCGNVSYLPGKEIFKNHKYGDSSSFKHLCFLGLGPYLPGMCKTLRSILSTVKKKKEKKKRQKFILLRLVCMQIQGKHSPLACFFLSLHLTTVTCRHLSINNSLL